jgi:hypothetical protein
VVSSDSSTVYGGACKFDPSFCCVCFIPAAAARGPSVLALVSAKPLEDPLEEPLEEPFEEPLVPGETEAARSASKLSTLWRWSSW